MNHRFVFFLAVSKLFPDHPAQLMIRHDYGDYRNCSEWVENTAENSDLFREGEQYKSYKFGRNAEDALQFGLGLTESPVIDGFYFWKILNGYSAEWDELPQFEEMGKNGVEYESDCSLYPCATFLYVYE